MFGAKVSVGLAAREKCKNQRVKMLAH